MMGKWDNLSKQQWETAEEKMICVFGVMSIMKSELHYHLKVENFNFMEFQFKFSHLIHVQVSNGMT